MSLSLIKLTFCLVHAYAALSFHQIMTVYSIPDFLGHPKQSIHVKMMIVWVEWLDSCNNQLFITDSAKNTLPLDQQTELNESLDSL